MHLATALLAAAAAGLAPASRFVAPPPVVEPKAPDATGTPTPPLASGEAKDGFVAIFDGTSLAGWTGDLEGYRVEAVKDAKGAEGAAIVCQPGGTNLFTKDEFADFEFRLEFLLTPGANNGIALRSPTEGDPAYVGFESQVLDSTAPQYKDLKEWQYHGSIYGVAAATATALRPVGEWNAETITMKGRRVKVELNGVVIVDVDLDVVAPGGKTVSGHKVEGLVRPKGHLGFCGHGDRVAYRNLRVRKL